MQHSKFASAACFALIYGLPAAAEGLLVTRTDGKIQFSPVFSLVVNGKDKIHTLGGKPDLAGAPVDKLPSVKLGATLIADTAAGVPVQYGTG